jgi:D-methionine transport system permease protein
MIDLLPEAIVRVLPEFYEAIWETVVMVWISMAAALLVGTPIGVLLHLTRPGGLAEQRGLAKVLGWTVNAVRSFPFVILIIAMIPITRLIVGRAIGPAAAAVPLSVAAVPFFARLVEQSLRDVPRGVAEAALACGASRFQVVRKVLLPEAMPSLIASFTTTVISFIAFSATAGLVGGGGIGDLAIRYGYNRFIEEVMYACVIILMVAVQVVQLIGNVSIRLVDKR